FFSSRRRHTRSKRDWSSDCALPISGAGRPGSEPLTGADVAARTLVSLPRGTSMRELADAALRGLDSRPAQRITTTLRDSLVPLAVAVDGLTIVPAVLARTAPAFGGRVVVLREAVRRSIGIIHRPDELPNPALQGFLALVRTEGCA